MKTLMASSEIFPLAKTGGLADVVGALGQHLVRLGTEVTLVMPAYRSLLEDRSTLESTGMELAVAIAGRTVRAAILKTRLGDKVPVYLIGEDSYFLRDNLYGTPQGDYADNAERFTFFSKAILELARRTAPWDVIHCHDWQTALVPVLKKAESDSFPEIRNSKTVLTIHNLGYQGNFPFSEWRLLGLDPRYFTPRYLEFYGKINFLKGGIVFADALTTVSREYANEIQTPEYGCGLEGVIRERENDLFGILNGVDYQEWSPGSDPHIKKNYGPEDLRGKKICKDDLQEIYGLPVKASVPVIGMVSRLADQKGWDILGEVIEDFIRRDLQLVILGSGEEKYQRMLTGLCSRHPKNIGVRIGFDNVVAHKIEAGADMFLMPSKYEPCGLNQIYSLKYGTIPIVRATGGLDDTIEDYNPLTGTGNGFKFSAYSGATLLEAVKRAIAVFSHEKAWNQLAANAMACDFSWGKSSVDYLALYRKLVETRTLL
jgi:starch synthase